MNTYCVDVQKKLAEEGLHSSILNGQDIASLYGDFAQLIQSGDIDVGSLRNEKGNVVCGKSVRKGDF